MNTAARYSLLRLLLFFGILMILWLVGLRNPLWLALAAATLSLLASWFLLAGLREQMSAELVERTERRRGRSSAVPGSDEDVEDHTADPDAFR